MAALTIQSVDTDGVADTLTAASGGGDTVAPTDAGCYFLRVNNGGGSSINVVINDPTSTDPGAATSFNPDVTVAVPNGTSKMIKLDVGRYKNTTTGLIDITYSGVTSVTVGAFKVA